VKQSPHFCYSIIFWSNFHHFACLPIDSLWTCLFIGQHLDSLHLAALGSCLCLVLSALLTRRLDNWRYPPTPRAFKAALYAFSTQLLAQPSMLAMIAHGLSPLASPTITQSRLLHQCLREPRPCSSRIDEVPYHETSEMEAGTEALSLKQTFSEPPCIGPKHDQSPRNPGFRLQLSQLKAILPQRPLVTQTAGPAATPGSTSEAEKTITSGAERQDGTLEKGDDINTPGAEATQRSSSMQYSSAGSAPLGEAVHFASMSNLLSCVCLAN